MTGTNGRGRMCVFPVVLVYPNGMWKSLQEWFGGMLEYIVQEKTVCSLIRLAHYRCTSKEVSAAHTWFMYMIIIKNLINCVVISESVKNIFPTIMGSCERTSS